MYKETFILIIISGYRLLPGRLSHNTKISIINLANKMKRLISVFMLLG